MQKENIINKTWAFVKEIHENDSTGHDLWHILRVKNTAQYIAKKENANMFIVEMAALLHDVDDWKLNPKNNRVQEHLYTLEISPQEKTYILNCIKNVSFKGAKVKDTTETIEGMVVQDADRLDALGAIGIARTFAYGGSKQREICNPHITPELHTTFEEYKNNNGPSLNHFFEKLLLLKQKMKTDTAKKIAEKRHTFLETYLKQFFHEWNYKMSEDHSIVF